MKPSGVSSPGRSAAGDDADQPRRRGLTNMNMTPKVETTTSKLARRRRGPASAWEFDVEPFGRGPLAPALEQRRHSQWKRPCPSAPRPADIAACSHIRTLDRHADEGPHGLRRRFRWCRNDQSPDDQRPAGGLHRRRSGGVVLGLACAVAVAVLRRLASWVSCLQWARRVVNLADKHTVVQTVLGLYRSSDRASYLRHRARRCSPSGDPHDPRSLVVRSSRA